MVINYKQRCYKCKKNFVTITWKQKFPVCYDCQKEQLNKEIKNKEMREFFNIPEEFYKNNLFLRSIKLSYLNFGKLTEKQKEAFKKTVEKMKEEKD